MRIVASIVIQAILLGLALVVTVLRCWIRLHLERRVLTASDYLVWAAWVFTVGWVACSIKILYLEIDHPLVKENTDSVDYLKTVFLACYFFDIGLYMPKASLIAFYWWLIPQGFRRLRIALYIGMVYMAMSLIASLLTDTLMARPISDNWSIEKQAKSIWNSFKGLAINWTLNFSTDLLLFTLPFFITNRVKLRRRQKIGLCVVFSLGLITLAISFSRFIIYAATKYGHDAAAGNAWCTAEMATATIVVSLPSLKTLITRSTPTNTKNRSINGGYKQTGSSKPPTSHHGGTVRSHIRGGKRDDDEMELVFLDKRPSPSSTAATTGTGGGAGMGGQDAKDGVMVTTDVVVLREGV